MKRIFLLAMIPFLFACNEGKIKQLQAEKDSLAMESEKKEEMIDDFFKALNEIEDNLSTIKEKEQIIRVTAGQKDISPDIKERINEDILSIYKLMLENKKKLGILQKKMKGSNVRIAQLKKSVDRLTQKLSSKNEEINVLKDELGKAHLDIKNLNLKIGSLSENLDSLMQLAETKDNIIDEKTTELNTAFYVLGTKKELKTQGIISKKGGFIGIGRMSKLKSNFNKDYFTKIDIRETKEILIKMKKAKIVTTHPASSYELLGDKKVDKLVIKNPQEFWSVSKYLVIEVN